MNYAERIDIVIQRLRIVAAKLDREKMLTDDEDLIECDAAVDNATADLVEIMHELDTTPRDNSPNCHGAPMVLIASFPYPHPEDRDRMRLAMYNKPCPSGDGSGEYIIWSECREDDHDGFREPSRNWGIYQGYVPDDHDEAFTGMLDKFSYKCARIVGPHVPAERRGYRRSEG